mmetsp:Transcript_23002/g.71631  ORF Transcript_23002/g.71631 Transcript_23002/m.71631 type:complete len:291 (+) Transcript_23002:630-1502(+)
MHLAGLHLLDHRIEAHADALPHEVVLHVGAHGLVEHCQNAGQSLHERDLEEVRNLGVAPLQVLLDEVRELAAELHARGPAAHDDEAQEPPGLRLVARGHGHVGLLYEVEHLLADLAPVLDLLEEAAVLRHARDAECVRLHANGNDEVVVVEADVVVAEHLPALEVDVPASDAEEVALRNVVADRLDDGAGRDDAGGAAHQQRGVEEEGPWGDHRHGILPWVELPHEGERAPARAEDDDLLPLHVAPPEAVQAPVEGVGDVVQVVVDGHGRDHGGAHHAGRNARVLHGLPR